MRKFGWVRGVGNKPIAQTWDKDFPTPEGLYEGTEVSLKDHDGRTLDELSRDYPAPKFPEE